MKTGATAGCSGLAGLGVGVIETLLVVLLTEFDNSEVAFLNSCKPLPTTDQFQAICQDQAND